MFFFRQSPEPEYPYENFFAPGPNPAPGLTTAAYKDPARAHSPIIRNKPWWYPHAGSVPGIQRVPGAHVPIPVKELPQTPVFAPAAGITPPELMYQRGWHQAFVPSAGMRQPLRAQTPLLQLSQPIHYGRDQSVAAAKRKPVKLRAPKARE